jgi:hypothetical protein
MICGSNVFFIKNPDPNPKLMLEPDENPERKKKKNYFGSTTIFDPCLKGPSFQIRFAWTIYG